MHIQYMHTSMNSALVPCTLYCTGVLRVRHNLLSYSEYYGYVRNALEYKYKYLLPIATTTVVVSRKTEELAER